MGYTHQFSEAVYVSVHRSDQTVGARDLSQYKASTLNQVPPHPPAQIESCHPERFKVFLQAKHLHSHRQAHSLQKIQLWLFYDFLSREGTHWHSFSWEISRLSSSGLYIGNPGFLSTSMETPWAVGRQAPSTQTAGWSGAFYCLNPWSSTFGFLETASIFIAISFCT